MVNDIETNVLEPSVESQVQVQPVQDEVYTGQNRVDANYIDTYKPINDEEKAYADYEKWKKQQELFKPENRLKEQGDFVLRELERGVPLKQAMYEAGIGKENLAEPSALLDPVNLVVDIFTGGTLRGLKLAREGGEIGLRHALTSMSKASAVDAGYGLLASSGIDLTHEFTDNSLIQMVGGVTTPVVASTLVQGFRRTGIQGLKAVADNLRKNNPELAEQLAKQADSYAEANLAINTASRSEVINDGSITGVAQNINTASTDLAHAIDAPRVNVQTSQDLRQQSQEALSKAASAKTDEERSMYLAEAFNKAFVDAFRTPEQKKALEVVQDTISRSMQPEDVAHNSPVSASGESLGMKGGADVQASTQGNSVEGVSSGLKTEGDLAAPGRVQPEAAETARVEPGVKQDVEPTVKGDDSNNNKNYVKPYTSEEIEGFKKAVLENDLAAPQNKVDYNYDKIADGRELKELIAKSFESFDFSKVTEGTRTWNEAVKIAEDHGLYDLVKTFRNTKNLDSQTFGALRTMHSLGDEVLRLAREATVAMTPESVVKAEHAIELFTDSLLMAKGIQTEIARGLGIMRKMRVGSEDIASTVMQHLESTGGIELFETKLKILKNLGEAGDKKALTQAIVGSTYTRTRDAFVELMYGSMLSNPSTVLPVTGVNSISGAFALFQNYTERLLASTWLGGRGVSKSEVEAFKSGVLDALSPRTTDADIIADRPLKALFDAAGISSDDAKYALHGVSNGWLDSIGIATSDAFKLAGRTFKENHGIIDNVSKLSDETLGQNAISGANFMLDGKLGAGLDLIGKVIGIGPRTMLLSDEFIKAAAYSGQYRALAVRTAEREGLAGEALAQRVTQLIQEPDGKLVDESLQFARYLNMQSPMTDNFSKNMQNIGNDFPVMKAILYPFLRVSVNMLKYTAERTPGVNLVLKQVRDDLFGNDMAKRALAISKMETGSMLYLTALGLVASDMYTGPGPIDPEARKLWIDAGNVPHAIKMGDKQYALNRLEPIATPIMILSELMTMPKHMQETDGSTEDGFRIVMGILYHMSSDRYYMKGVAQLFDALRDKSGTGLEKMLGNVASTMVPLSGLNKAVNRMVDPTVKDAWGVWENVKKSLPFEGVVLDHVPVKRTILGEPVYYDHARMKDEDFNTLFNFDGAFTLFSPVAAKTPLNDSTYEEMVRLANKNLFTRRAIKDKFSFNGEVYEVTHAQHTEINDIMRNEKLLDGKTGKQFVEDIVKSQEYLSLPSDVIKADILNDAVKTVHDVSIHRYMSKHPELITRGIDNKAAKVNRALGLTEELPERKIRQ